MAEQALARTGDAAAKPARAPWERRARNWSGLVLFFFVTTHFLNHALGVFGVEAMEAAQEWRWLLWKSRPGAVLLYGAAAVHIALALRRVARRQTWRMPLDEAFQIVTGLAIPVLIVGHVTGTRIGGSFFGTDESYPALLNLLWPALWENQTLLLLVVWAHGCLGIYHAFRHHGWFKRARLVLFALAILVPALSLAGFVAGAREVKARGGAPPVFTDAQFPDLVRAENIVRAGIGAAGALFLGVIAFRALRRRAAGRITIAYRGRGPVSVPKGTSVLEASRIADIPHPSVCGGRGRCSTCRIHVLSSLDALPAPNVVEATMLRRIAAQPGVRLACQLRPTKDLSVQILMPVLGGRRSALAEAADGQWGVDRRATVLAIDLRAFGTIAQQRLAYEVAVLLNRFLAEMRQAVHHYGGRVDVFYGEGLVAIFETDDDADGADAALRAVVDMSRVLESLNRELGNALPLPIRAGFGLHTGPMIVARIAPETSGADRIALGHAVQVADRLQSATGEVLADIVVSEACASAARYDFSRFPKREVTVEAIGAAVTAYAVRDAAQLRDLLKRGAAEAEAPRPEPVEARA